MHLLDKRSTRALPVALMIHDNLTDRMALVLATHHSNFCPITFDDRIVAYHGDALTRHNVAEKPNALLPKTAFTDVQSCHIGSKSRSRCHWTGLRIGLVECSFGSYQRLRTSKGTRTRRHDWPKGACSKRCLSGQVRTDPYGSAYGFIGMSPYEALYGRPCRTPLCWTQVGERSMIGPEIVEETTEKIKFLRDKMRQAQDRQKNYADRRRKDLEFQVGDLEIHSGSCGNHSGGRSLAARPIPGCRRKSQASMSRRARRSLQNLGHKPGRSVQILVVVANIQMRTLKAEVGKAGARRVVSDAFPPALENPEDRVPLTPSRTLNRIRSPR
ncbi:unnamed protein product [Brassica rapa subsp. narinosa]